MSNARVRQPVPAFSIDTRAGIHRYQTKIKYRY